MVLTVSFVLSPAIGLLVTVAGANASSIVANLMSASRHQDHTTSPSAKTPLVRRRDGVHRIPHPTSVTIAKRPSGRARDTNRDIAASTPPSSQFLKIRNCQSQGSGIAGTANAL
jgi:hypothetical protein